MSRTRCVTTKPYLLVIYEPAHRKVIVQLAMTSDQYSIPRAEIFIYGIFTRNAPTGFGVIMMKQTEMNNIHFEMCKMRAY